MKSCGKSDCTFRTVFTHVNEISLVISNFSIEPPKTKTYQSHDKRQDVAREKGTERERERFHDKNKELK